VACSVVCRSVVCRSVCYTSESCKKGCIGRDSVLVEDRVGTGRHVLDGGSDPHGNGQFGGEKGRPIVK